MIVEGRLQIPDVANQPTQAAPDPVRLHLRERLASRPIIEHVWEIHARAHRQRHRPTDARIDLHQHWPALRIASKLHHRAPFLTDLPNKRLSQLHDLVEQSEALPENPHAAYG